jgi:hypothetical protein
MTSLDRYAEIFINRAKKLLEEEDLNNNPEYLDVFKNHLLALKGPKQLARKITPHDIFFSKLMVGFNEIYNSYSSLLDIQVYIGRFPYSKTRVSKTRYIAYHMENYFNEVYILKERLNAYCTIIARLYKNDQTLKDLTTIINSLSEYVQKSLKGITDVRGKHIHSNRLKDENLDRLNTLELINHGPKRIPAMKYLYASVYRDTRKKFCLSIKQNNEAIKKILDEYFDVLYKVVTNDKRQIRYPELKKA